MPSISARNAAKKTAKTLPKAGTAVGKRSTAAREVIPVNLRIEPATLEQINASVQRRRVRTSRHTWIMEAVIEKLDREADAAELREAEAELLAIREGRSFTTPLEDVMRVHGNLED